MEAGKILIEASEAFRNRSGIGRFSRALIAHLPPDLPLAFSPPNYASRQYTPSPRTLAGRAVHAAQHLWLTQLAVLRAVRAERPALLHSLSFFIPLLAGNLPCVATFFDLAYFDLPHDADRWWGAYGRLMMPIAARRAAAVITPSEAVRQAVMARFGLPAERVHRVYGGVDAHFRPVNDPPTLERVRRRYGIEGPFVLYVGAWHAPKNLPILFEACARLPEVKLVITGTPHTPYEARLIERARTLDGRAIFTGHVPDDDLPALYSAAVAAVLPSRYEGFGLTALEAMACGTPAIVSDIPALAEITGGAALTFPPDSADALREAIRSLLASPSEREVWAGRALARAARFSWPRTAQEIVRVWQGVK
jgi:glycosyltransferase involved in cell wall biosynthesis